MEPTKNVAESQRTPTEVAYGGSAPSTNSADPTANRTAIHHPRAPGAHQVDPCAASC